MTQYPYGSQPQQRPGQSGQSDRSGQQPRQQATPGQQARQQFSRPGAVDLSGLGGAGAPAGGAPGEGGAAGGGSRAVSGAYCVTATEQNLNELLESSMSAPVILVFFSASQRPDSVRVADDLQTLSNEMEGKFLLGRVDIDADPRIAQAMQVQDVPLVALVAQGRPMPLFQQVVSLEEMRQALNQVFQQLATQGFTGRHQPRAAAAPSEESGAPTQDPRYAAADDALQRGDLDGAIAEYERLLAANPGDTEASRGLTMSRLLRRTQDADLQQARRDAADQPDDVDAQTLVADLDLLGGHVEDAFSRLVELVRRTSDAERERARTHLIELFAAVGNDDARVLKARRALASALF